MSDRVPDHACAMDAAVRILAGREHSEAQLAAKLARRGFPPAVIRDTLTRLRELTYIDDRRFARALIRERLLLRRRGRLDARAQLLKAGVEAAIIDEALCEVADDASLDEGAICREAARKRLASLREPDPRKRRDKLARHLAGRGFSLACITRTLESLGTLSRDEDTPDDLDIDPDS